MSSAIVALQGGLVERSVEAFVEDIVAAIPSVISGLVFLALAAILVTVILFIVDRVLDTVIRPEADIYKQFVHAIVAAVLWFSVALAFLAIVGLGAIAASLGTAAGFIALGVSYALSNMIADAVAGVYLIRDPDFQVGDEITTGDVTGTVRAIELRKTRLAVDDGILVQSNAEIEKQWRKLTDSK